MLNKVMLIGNVGGDPNVTHFEKTGGVVARFSLATSERFKDKDGQVQTRTEWHNIVIWGKLADIVEKYVKKGSTLYLEGKIQQEEYKDKEGSKKYSTNIVCHSMNMLDSKEGHTKEPSAKERINQEDLEDSDDLPF